MIIRGEVTATLSDGTKIRTRNTIVNLPILLSRVVVSQTLPSSVLTPQIRTNFGTYPATYTVQPYQNGYVFIFKATFPQASTLVSAFLLPNSLSIFSDPLASVIYSRPIPGVTSLEWAIYVEDQTGLLYNTLLPTIIPSANYYPSLYAEDGNANYLSILQAFEQYVYGFFVDNTNASSIGYVNAHWFTFVDYTTTPSAIQIGNNFALQLVPASGSQHAVFYYLLNSSSFSMQFAFSSSSSPPADGFAICLYSTSPPIALNTSTPSGMVNGTVAYGQGNQIVVEFDPYASQPFSVTTWTSSGYQSTILSASGAGSGFSMTANDIYTLNVNVSGTTMSISLFNATTGQTVATQSVTLPFTPPSYGYVIVTARTGGNYANWSLVNISGWYPYSASFKINLTPPRIIPITAIYSGD